VAATPGSAAKVAAPAMGIAARPCRRLRFRRSQTLFGLLVRQVGLRQSHSCAAANKGLRQLQHLLRPPAAAPVHRRRDGRWRTGFLLRLTPVLRAPPPGEEVGRRKRGRLSSNKTRTWHHAPPTSRGHRKCTILCNKSPRSRLLAKTSARGAFGTSRRLSRCNIVAFDWRRSRLLAKTSARGAFGTSLRLSRCNIVAFDWRRLLPCQMPKS